MFMAHRDWTSFAIAKACKADPGYVRKVLNRRGLSLKIGPYDRRRLQDWERQAIVDAYIDGEKIEAVASEFKVCAATVINNAKRAGLKMRRGK